MGIRKLLDRMERTYVARQLEVRRDEDVAGLRFDLTATGKAGSLFFGLIGWRDHLFVANAARLQLDSPDGLREAHALVRDRVNERYKTPRALRLTVPAIALVAVFPGPIPDECSGFVRDNSFVTVAGGEANAVFLIHDCELVARTPGRRESGSMPIHRLTAELRSLVSQTD